MMHECSFTVYTCGYCRRPETERASAFRVQHNVKIVSKVEEIDQKLEVTRS